MALIVNCDANSLMNAAACFRCIPAGLLSAVQVSLLCQWANKPAGPSACVSAIVDDYEARVAINGGTPISANTRLALCTFCNALDAHGFLDLDGSGMPTNNSIIRCVNAFVPDNLIACETPLLVDIGLMATDPWNDIGGGAFVNADLNANGLIGDGVSKALNTGIVSDDLQSVPDKDSSLIIYVSEGVIEPTNDIGAGELGTVNHRIYTNYNSVPPTCSCTAYTDVSTLSYNQAVGIPFEGYLCSSRTVANRYIFTGDSITGHVQRATSAVLAGTPPANVALAVFATNENGAILNYSSRRLSFVAMGMGLTPAQSADLFDLVQALRMDLGGGWV